MEALGALHPVTREHISLRPPPSIRTAFVVRHPQSWPKERSLTPDHPTREDNANWRMPDVLCPGCAPVFAKSKLINGSRMHLVRPVEHYEIHNSLKDFLDASRAGCHFCTLAFAKAFEGGLPIPIETTPSIIGLRITISEDTPSVEVTFNGLVPWKSWQGTRQTRGLWSFRCQGHQGETEGFKPQPDVCRRFCSTGSKEHMRLAKFWLDECCSKHSCCLPKSTDTKPPTRLLFLGADRSSMRLQMTSPDDGGIRYCALSHCWGGATDILTLKQSNIDQLCSRVEYQDLPRTFQDATDAARAVGIDYLWIDSLCIIQDSEEDWKREAPTMGRVYERATLTIAATNARSAHDGCFSTTNPLLSNPCRIVGSQERGLWIEGRRTDAEATGERTLRRRGWVLQETLLSRRTLCFGPDGILWHCEAGMADFIDSYGRGTPVVSDDDRPSRIFGPDVEQYSSRNLRSLIEGKDGFNRMMAFSKTLRDSRSLEVFSSAWAEVVLRYSDCELTRPDEDKLVALSGIASRVQRATGLTYVAGLWKETLVTELCWQNRSQVIARRSLAYRAPSWSWAAVDGSFMSAATDFFRAEFGPDSEYSYLAKVVDVSVQQTPSDEGSIGIVLPGTSLTLLAKLKRVEAGLAKESERHPTALLHFPQTLNLPYPGVQKGTLYPDHSNFGEGHQDIHLLPLVLRKVLNGAPFLDDVNWVLYGIVVSLSKVNNDCQQEAFERVGSFDLEFYIPASDTQPERTATEIFEGLTDREIIIV